MAPGRPGIFRGPNAWYISLSPHNPRMTHHDIQSVAVGLLASAPGTFSESSLRDRDKRLLKYYREKDFYHTEPYIPHRCPVPLPVGQEGIGLSRLTQHTPG